MAGKEYPARASRRRAGKGMSGLHPTRAAALLLFGLLGTLMIGCSLDGLQTELPGRSRSGQHTYVAAFSDGALLVRWTESGDPPSVTLSGVIQQATLTDDGADIESTNVNFAGVRSNGDVSLEIPQRFGFATTLTGELEGAVLTLFLAGDDGSLVPVRLTRATVDDYNQAVDQLREVAEGTRIAEEELARSESAVRQAQQAVDQGTRELSAAVGDLQRTVGDLRFMVGQLQFDLGLIEGDLVTLEGNAEAYKSTGDPYYLDLVEGDLVLWRKTGISFLRIWRSCALGVLPM